MNRPLDTKSPRHVVTVSHPDSHPANPPKHSDRKPPAHGAGRMADNGGTLRVASPSSAANRHAAPAPSKPVIPARYFLKAGSLHETLASKIDAPDTLGEILDALTPGPVTTKRRAPPHPPSPRVVAVAHRAKPADIHDSSSKLDRSVTAANKQHPQATPAPAKSHVQNDAIKSPEPHIQYEDIKAQAAADEMKALRALNEAYVKDPRTLNNDGAWEPIVAVVTRANAPLMEIPRELASPQVQTNAAIQFLDRAIKNLDPGLAAEIVKLALPTYEKFYEDHRDALPDNALFGPVGTGPLMDLASQIAGTPHGDDAVARFARIGGFHAGGVYHALAVGAGPAYGIEFTRQLKADGIDPSLALRTINDGMVQFRRDVIADVNADVERIDAHKAELAWLVKNDGPALSTQQLDQAVASYVADPVWKSQGEELCQHLSDKGVKLIRYMVTLGKIPPDAGCADLIRQTINTLLSDPATSLAISMALKNDPRLTNDKELKGIAGLLALDTFRKSGDLARKFTGELASAILRRKVLEKLKDLDLFDPVSVKTAKAAMESLRQETFVGLGSGGVNNIAGAINNTIDEMAAATSNTKDIASLKAAQVVSLKKLNDELLNDPSIVKAFANDTLAGLLFRGFVVGFASLNLYNNARKFMDKPGALSGVQAFVASVDFAQKSSELLVGMGTVSKASAIGRFGGGWRLLGRASAGDLISVISSGLDAFNGVRSLFGWWGAEQDTGDAIFSFAGAAGGGLISAQAFGFAAGTGPPGIALTTAALVGKEIYNNAKDAHKYEAASKKFLMAAGYRPEAAEALCRRGDYPSLGAGLGQMPFLAKYAEFKKMTPDQLRDWICGLTPDQVRNLSEVVLFTLHNGFRLDVPNLSLPRRVQVGRVERLEYYTPTKAQIIADFDNMLENRNVPHSKDGSSNVSLYR